MYPTYAGETNGLVDPKLYGEVVTHEAVKTFVEWDDPRLAKIVRLRLLSDPGFPMWDVSYCHGQLKDGTYVTVQLPFMQLPKGKGKIAAAIISYAKACGVYAKGLGIFEAISTLN